MFCTYSICQQHMFGSHGLPVSPSHPPPPRGRQDGSPLTFSRRMSVVCAHDPVLLISHYLQWKSTSCSPSFKELKFISQRRGETMPSPCSGCKQYKQSQLNIIHLITLLSASVLEIAFMDLLLFGCPLCACTFLVILPNPASCHISDHLTFCYVRTGWF